MRVAPVISVKSNPEFVPRNSTLIVSTFLTTGAATAAPEPMITVNVSLPAPPSIESSEPSLPIEPVNTSSPAVVLLVPDADGLNKSPEVVSKKLVVGSESSAACKVARSVVVFAELVEYDSARPTSVLNVVLAVNSPLSVPLYVANAFTAFNATEP